MGVHFTVTVNHDFTDTQLPLVRDRFASLQPRVAEISLRSQQALGEWRDVTEPGRPRPDHFYAPAGFPCSSGLLRSDSITAHASRHSLIPLPSVICCAGLAGSSRRILVSAAFSTPLARALVTRLLTG